MNEAGTSGGEPRSILKRRPSTSGAKTVHFEQEQSCTGEKSTVAMDSDDDDEPNDASDEDLAEDDVEEDAFTGLIVERDSSGKVLASVGEPQLRLSRFKASKL